MFKEFVNTPWRILKDGAGQLIKGNLTENVFVVIGVVVLVATRYFFLAAGVFFINFLSRWLEKVIFNIEVGTQDADSQDNGITGWTGLVVLLTAVLTVVVWVLVTSGQGEIGWREAVLCGIAVLLSASPQVYEKTRGLMLNEAMKRAEKEALPVEKKEDLRILGEATVAIFDKTGVITEGTPTVEDVILADGQGQEKILSLAMSLEKGLEHPIGKAISRKSVEAKVHEHPAEDVTYFPGKGISGKINGKFFYLGSQRYMEECLGVQKFAEDVVDKLKQERIYRKQREGKTMVFIAEDDGLLGAFSLADEIKETSIEAITMMGMLGIEVIMLTGDSRETADVISKKTGVTTTLANLVPEEKKRIIKELQTDGNVVIMAERDSGVDNADLIISRGDLIEVERLLNLGRNIETGGRGLGIATAMYNLLAVLSATGVFYQLTKVIINPLLATIVMNLFSLCFYLLAGAIANKKII